MTSSTKLKQLASNVNSIVQQLDEDVKEVIQTTAEQKLEEVGGKNAKTANVRQLITQEIDKRHEDITAMMTQSMSSTKVNTSSSAKIEITAPKSINISGTTIDANAIIDSVTSSITSNSVDLGKRIARDIMTSAASSSDTSTRHKGQEELINAMGKANSDAIKQQSEGLTNMIKALNDPSILAMVVCGVVLIAVIKAVSGGKGNDMQQQAVTVSQNQAGTAGAEYEAGTAGSQDPADTAGAQDPAGTAGKPVVGVLVPETGENTLKGVEGQISGLGDSIKARMPVPFAQKAKNRPITVGEIVFTLGKLVLLCAICFHTVQVVRPILKLSKGEKGAALGLMNPFKGISLSFESFGSLVNLANPFTQSTGLFQGLLKLYITLCITDFICKFPYKIFLSPGSSRQIPSLRSSV